MSCTERPSRNVRIASLPIKLPDVSAAPSSASFSTTAGSAGPVVPVSRSDKISMPAIRCAHLKGRGVSSVLNEKFSFLRKVAYVIEFGQQRAREGKTYHKAVAESGRVCRDHQLRECGKDKAATTSLSPSPKISSYDHLYLVSTYPIRRFLAGVIIVEADKRRHLCSIFRLRDDNAQLWQVPEKHGHESGLALSQRQRYVRVACFVEVTVSACDFLGEQISRSVVDHDIDLEIECLFRTHELIVHEIESFR